MFDPVFDVISTVDDISTFRAELSETGSTGSAVDKRA